MINIVTSAVCTVSWLLRFYRILILVNTVTCVDAFSTQYGRSKASLSAGFCSTRRTYYHHKRVYTLLPVLYSSYMPEVGCVKQPFLPPLYVVRRT